MIDTLSASELLALVQRVFRPSRADRRLAVIVDLPDAHVADNPAWRDRRLMAAEWATQIDSHAGELDLDGADLFLYGNVHANNADLPADGVYHRTGPLPENAAALSGERIAFEELFRSHGILIAPTEFSTTAPLKVAARRIGFRAATMPGFSSIMIPALRLDYGRIGARVKRLKRMLDEAESARIDFEVDGESIELLLDLRFRTAHESSGILTEPGIAGNLPSGEAYIVPYEGEREPSRSNGQIPVQFGDEVVRYRIVANRAVEVLPGGTASAAEALRLADEPAYGNLAELGLGVLDEFGLQPTGELLLDEKLGLHIAFGRSDHFGGQCRPADFSRPDHVVHIDRVYTRSLQPSIGLARVDLVNPGGLAVPLMRDGRYVVDFD